MIISPSRKFIFIHIPKTGGTALTLAYESKARKDDLLFGDTPKATKRQAAFKRKTGLSLGKHSRLRDVAEQRPDVLTPDMLCVSIIRNPWDRMLSFYTWARAQTFDHVQIKLAQTLEFTDFIQHEDIQSSFLASRVEGYFKHHTIPEDQLLLLRFEKLAADVAMFAERIGCKFPPLPRVNTSDRPRDYRGAYTDQTAAVIPALFPYETQYLGYTFE